MRSSYWIAPLCLVALMGCNDLLTETPEDFVTPGQFYNTTEDATAAVNGIYAGFMSMDLYRHRLGWELDTNSDVSVVGYNELAEFVLMFGRMSVDPAAVQIQRNWQDFYVVIARANLAIDRLATAEGDAAVKASLMGEAKFLRALAYAQLVRIWGGVPLILSSEMPDPNVARAPAADVYAQIVKDAQDAAAALPVTRSAGEQGRATRGAALTLLADIYLYQHDWQKAADYAKQVIDLGVYSLFPDYLQAFLPANKNGREHIFSFQAEVGPAGSAYVNAYYPFEIPKGRGGGGAIVQPTQWQLDSYIPGDYRREVTYTSDWEDTGGKKYHIDLPHVSKYRSTSVASINNGDVNIAVYRYAEVLLIYAEALNELGRSAEAVPFVNQVRARARNGTGNENRAQPANYSGSMSKDAVRDLVYDERRWELAHEFGKRWFDLKRRGADYFMSQLSAHDPQAVGLEPNDTVYPIPLIEIDLNPNLTQNPGF